MTDNNIMKCQKAGHMNQKYLYLNFSATSKQNLLICPICISQEQFIQISENKKIPQNLLIDQILDNKVSSHEILGWPPIQEEKNKQIFQESQNFLKQIGNQQGSLLNFFKDKIGTFEIDNQNQKIIFKKENSRFSKFVYSDKLQQDQNYHLRLKLDLANQVANTDLGFIFTNQEYKNTDLFGFNYRMYPFYKQNKAYGQGRYLLYMMEGKQFFEFFQDNQTVVNFVFNIEKCLFEIYDDQKIFYMKAEVTQKINYQNLIFMIGFQQEKQNKDVQIQFLN
ncbi:hypothetical protein PPERSA_08139 [Pseudocohnilembus persalinus]|uniref:Uncharacterized protein n=1 Tax=Pseudocohnilembus persalinus TaxID=266149 RepID=A0A0V0QN72_PSEPJ|nr:hypothetical protein PPERSA_08139 [Pseudocohnilembus persalinus]|eukprot:KRX03397.1 hypothetical protein PPERSA_08139 [Pseudocohnilembus persalinus]